MPTPLHSTAQPRQRKRWLGITVVGLVLCAMLLFLRVCTGIVYEADAPFEDLVLKRTWDVRPERPETAAERVARDIVMDRDEPALLYTDLYLTVMRSARWSLPLLLAATLLSFTVAKRSGGR